MKEIICPFLTLAGNEHDRWTMQETWSKLKRTKFQKVVFYFQIYQTNEQRTHLSFLNFLVGSWNLETNAIDGRGLLTRL